MTAALDMEKVRAHIISHKELRDAIAYALRDEMGKITEDTEKNATKTAAYLLNFFGYGDRIIDNVLDTDDRDNFYLMEETGVLTTAREEINLLKGKIWRMHYWLLKKDSILRYAAAYNEDKNHPPEENPAATYENLEEEAWQRAPVEAGSANE
jgi:hypothetical protein